MPTGLYLDSARLGLMPLRASRAHHEFVRLVGREGASAAVIDLLQGGFDSWPRDLRGRYPDLSDWRGMGPFFQAIRALTGAPPAAETFLSSHSAPLMGLAAHLLCQTCRVILHTDLEWSPWLEILRAEAGRRGRRLVGVPLRELLIEHQVGSGGLIERLGRAYRRSAADGLFLTEITHDGIRLPLSQLVASLEAAGVPQFVVVDAAQALGHAPLDLGAGPGDLYLAGCHKWVGSGLPLSVAVAPRRRTGKLVCDVAESLLRVRLLDDPLLRFARMLSAGDFERPGGTVNLAPLFPASAAVSVQLGRTEPVSCGFEQRLQNRRVLSLLAHESGWQPITTHRDFQSGILTVGTGLDEARGVTPDRLRRCFRRHGVSLTAFPGGIVRASLPDIEWGEAWLGAVFTAFRGVRLDIRGRESRPPRAMPGWIVPTGQAAFRPDGSL